MSRRALTVWVDCEAEMCGACEFRAGRWCCLWRDPDFFKHPGGGPGNAIALKPTIRNDYRRCQACLAAESKALHVPGVKPPDRDSSGGHKLPGG